MIYFLVLAGGESTRLPNKLFLTTASGTPVCLSAYRAIYNAEYHSLSGPATAVVGPYERVSYAVSEQDAPFVQTLFKRTNTRATIHLERERKGIVSAIADATLRAQEQGCRFLCVLCGDNIYPAHWLENLVVSLHRIQQPTVDMNLAFTKFASDIRKSEELDRYDLTACKWVPRKDSWDVWVERNKSSDRLLLTPWVFSVPSFDTIREHRGRPLLELFNNLQVAAVTQEQHRYDPAKWFDLGTALSWKIYKKASCAF